MNQNTRNTYAAFALDILKTATLEVLYEKTSPSKSVIRQDEIRKQLDIKKIDYSWDPGRHNALIFGILMHLREDGYANHLSGYGWQITEKGIEIIEGK